MDGPKLEWMYRNSNEVVDKEEYLLGKPVDKTFEQTQANLSNEIEKDCLPTSIFASAGSNVQVDVIRKLKEDPLEVIRQQEIERRKQLLKNPVKLKKLQNMLKVKENGGTVDKKTKEKRPNNDNSSDIDKLLASKYLKIMKKHGIKSLSELSNMKVEKKSKSKKSKGSVSSDEYSSSSESESDEDNIRKRKENLKKKREHRSTSSDLSDGHKKKHSHSYKKGNSYKTKETDKHKDRNYYKDKHYKRSHTKPSTYRTSSDNVTRTNKSKEPENKTSVKEDFSKEHTYRSDKSSNRRDRYKSQGLSEQEKQKRLEEMMENAKWRDDIRSKNVARYKKEESSEKTENYSEDFMRKQMKRMLASSNDSVESRIKSNINNIQKSKFTMNENFVRR